MTESEIQHNIRIAVGMHPDVRLFRNNVGVAKVRNAYVRYGLANGSADLIGWVKLEPPIVPFRIARFMSLEIKTETGKLSPEQVLWMKLVRNWGGFAAVVRSVDDALAAVERARAGEIE